MCSPSIAIPAFMMAAGTAAQYNAQQKQQRALDRAAEQRRRAQAQTMRSQRDYQLGERERQEDMDDERQSIIQDVLGEQLGVENMESRMQAEAEARASAMRENEADRMTRSGHYAGPSDGNRTGGAQTGNRVVEARQERLAADREEDLSERASAAGQLDSLGDVLQQYQFDRTPSMFELSANKDAARRHANLTEQGLRIFDRENQYADSMLNMRSQKAKTKGQDSMMVGSILSQLGAAGLNYGAAYGGGGGSTTFAGGAPEAVAQQNTAGKLAAMGGPY